MEIALHRRGVRCICNPAQRVHCVLARSAQKQGSATLNQLLLGTVPLLEQIVHSTTTKRDNFTMYLYLIMLHHYTAIQADGWDH
jgi:hypothetical protein